MAHQNFSEMIKKTKSEITELSVEDAAKKVNDYPNMQRLGYILDHVRRKRITSPLHALIHKTPPHLRHPRPLPLPDHSRAIALAYTLDLLAAALERDRIQRVVDPVALALILY